jgi:hypothetical protein
MNEIKVGHTESDLVGESTQAKNDCGVSRFSSSACRMGSANADVFPDPVCASAIRSLPAPIPPKLRLGGCNYQPPNPGWRTMHVTLEGVGDGLGLDPSRLLPLRGVARLQQFWAEAEIRERGRQTRRRVLLLLGRPRDHCLPVRHGPFPSPGDENHPTNPRAWRGGCGAVGEGAREGRGGGFGVEVHGKREVLDILLAHESQPKYSVLVKHGSYCKAILDRGVYLKAVIGLPSLKSSHESQPKHVVLVKHGLFTDRGGYPKAVIDLPSSSLYFVFAQILSSSTDF